MSHEALRSWRHICRRLRDFYGGDASSSENDVKFFKGDLDRGYEHVCQLQTSS